MLVFVENGLPSDFCKIKITAVKKKYAVSNISEMITPSPFRKKTSILWILAIPLPKWSCFKIVTKYSSFTVIFSSIIPLPLLLKHKMIMP